MENIRQEIENIASNDTISKELALQIMKIQHIMETYFIEETYKKNIEIQTLQQQLQSYSDFSTVLKKLELVSQDVTKLYKTFEELQQLVLNTSQELKELKSICEIKFIETNRHTEQLASLMQKKK